MRFAFFFFALAACGGGGSSARTKNDAPVTDSRSIADSQPVGDSLIVGDAPSGDDAPTPSDALVMDGPSGVLDAKVFLDAPAGTYPLTVKNYLSWCTVEINNSGTFSTLTPQTVNVAPGTIALAAKPASTIFELGPTMWHHVDGTTGDTGIAGAQTGTGVTATSTTSITITNAGACVWVCCPFASDGSGCDAATIGDQCP